MSGTNNTLDALLKDVQFCFCAERVFTKGNNILYTISNKYNIKKVIYSETTSIGLEDFNKKKKYAAGDYIKCRLFSILYTAQILRIWNFILFKRYTVRVWCKDKSDFCKMTISEKHIEGLCEESEAG